MLEWTGERFLPWVKDASIAYEHLHRYAYAAELVRNKRVLDLASGEGYGSNLLARAAASVVGVDINADTVKHASEKYTSNNLRFITGSIVNVPVPEGGSFDAIVCFEAIEHIAEHEKLLAEVKRLLAPGGLFIVSTPNKAVYDQESHEENKFHVKELTVDEFRGLLSKHFRNVTYLGQRIHADSNIWPMQNAGDHSVREFVIERSEGEFAFIQNDRRVPMYVIAVASDSPVSLPDSGSVLVDHSNELLNDRDRSIRELLETMDSQEKALEWKEKQVAQRDESIGSLEKAVAWHETQAADLRDSLKSAHEAVEWMTTVVKDTRTELEETKTELEETKKTIASHEEALAWRAHQVEDFQKEIATLYSHLETTQRQLRITTEELEAIHASRGWKLILRLRHYRDKLKGLVKSPERR